MRLFIVRHGIAADPADFKGPDGSRPLTGKGRKRFKRTAKAFAKQDTPAHIFTSPLVRAVQTAELLARGCGTDEVEVLEELLPDGPPAKLLNAVHARLKKGESAALVGHDPQLTLLVAHLAGTNKDLELMKGAIVCVELPSLPEPKGAVVQWTLWPKEKEPRDGPPIVKSEKELAAEAAAAEEKKRAKKAEKKAAHEKKKAEKQAEKEEKHAEKEAARAQKRHEREAHAKARELAKQRAAAKRKQKTKEARPPAGSAKGPDPKRRVAKPRRSLPVRSVPAVKPPPAPAPKVVRPKKPVAKPPSAKPATAKPPVQIVKPAAPQGKPVAPPPKAVAPKPVAPKPVPQAAKPPNAPTPPSPPAQAQPKPAPAAATQPKPAEPALPKPAPAAEPDDGSSE